MTREEFKRQKQTASTGWASLQEAAKAHSPDFFPFLPPCRPLLLAALLIALTITEKTELKSY